MKTQIGNLINGAKDVRRDMGHQKYVGAPRATSHIGYAGVSRKERNAIASKVMAENPEYMKISLFGKEFALTKVSSTTGDSAWYICDITLDDFMLISGYEMPPFSTRQQCKFALLIDNSMKVYTHKWCRKEDRNAWKFRGCDYIDESFVTIL